MNRYRFLCTSFFYPQPDCASHISGPKGMSWSKRSAGKLLLYAFISWDWKKGQEQSYNSKALVIQWYICALYSPTGLSPPLSACTRAIDSWADDTTLNYKEETRAHVRPAWSGTGLCCCFNFTSHGFYFQLHCWPNTKCLAELKPLCFVWQCIFIESKYCLLSLIKIHTYTNCTKWVVKWNNINFPFNFIPQSLPSKGIWAIIDTLKSTEKQEFLLTHP